MGDLQHYLGFGLGLLALTSSTVALARWAGVGLGLFPLWAVLRAVVQLTVVALLLRGILEVPWTVVLFLALMLTTASWTSVRRLGLLWRGRRAAVLGGASPAEAAQFQLVVLAGIALAMTLTCIVVTQITGRTPYLAVRA
ncbi:ABC transporter permease [Nocardioides conyzicola]|uniref:ABC transporter permease n=1 Tax=Nocardioides conyzicola TaxID=1651781 RepID=A0ABP8WLW3_9ACTN